MSMPDSEVDALMQVLEITLIGTYDEVHAADEVGRRDYGRKIVGEVMYRQMLPSVGLRILRGGEP